MLSLLLLFLLADIGLGVVAAVFVVALVVSRVVVAALVPFG